MQMNNQNFREFRDDFAKATKEMEEKYGVKLEMGGITYDSDSFHFKVTVTNTDSIISPKDEFIRNVKAFAFLGLTEDMYEQIFMGSDHKKYKLVGLKVLHHHELKMNARKNLCVVTSLTNGKEYVCPPDFLGISPKY